MDNPPCSRNDLSTSDVNSISIKNNITLYSHKAPSLKAHWNTATTESLISFRHWVSTQPFRCSAYSEKAKGLRVYTVSLIHPRIHIVHHIVHGFLFLTEIHKFLYIFIFVNASPYQI